MLSIQHAGVGPGRPPWPCCGEADSDSPPQAAGRGLDKPEQFVKPKGPACLLTAMRSTLCAVKTELVPDFGWLVKTFTIHDYIQDVLLSSAATNRQREPGE